jgi:hypothetical protein
MRLRLGIDQRLGGVRRVYLSDPEAALLNIPDRIRKSVTFLQYQTGGGLHVAGTAFFVGVQEEGEWFPYAVTARHVVESIRNKAIDGQASFRLNLIQGGIEVVDVEVRHWRYHPTDATTDVAVLHFPVPERFDAQFLPIQEMATSEERIARFGIGIGDEIFTVGLFHLHCGTRRNIPIVRCGNIAAMPEEPIELEKGLMDAYLVEIRSIGGLSGSPVFTYLLPYGDQAMFRREKSIYLLGLMHGHWNVDTALIDELTPDRSRDERLNTGIGVVVPIAKVIEALDQPALRDQRRTELAEIKAKQAPTPDKP